MHHLHEVAGTARSAVQVATRGSVTYRSRRGRAATSLARRDRGEDRVEALDDVGLAADHEAEAALESPDAANAPTVHVVQTTFREPARTVDVVAVVGVAPVDDDVVLVEEGRDALQGRPGHAGGEHEPDGPRPRELADEVLERGGAGDVAARECRHRGCVDVVDDAPVAVIHESANEVRSHSSEAHHP